MRPFILISLWAEDDEATSRAHAFALGVHKRRPASAFIAGDAPNPAELNSAVLSYPDAPIVVFSHGGQGLSARSSGAPWLDVNRCAELLKGRRIYAFACDTFCPQPTLVHNTFANAVVDGCVSVFIGHDTKVMTPIADAPETFAKMADALHALIDKFIDGEDSALVLSAVGRLFAAGDTVLELDLASESPLVEGALGWSSIFYLEGVFKSIHACVKGQNDPLSRTT